MDTIKIIGTTTIYLLHPDSKKLVEMTFTLHKIKVVYSCHVTLR